MSYSNGVVGGLTSRDALLSRRVFILFWILFWLFIFCGITIPPDANTPPSTFYRACNSLTYVVEFVMFWTVGGKFAHLYRMSVRVNPTFQWLKHYLVVVGWGTLTGFAFIADRSEYLHNLGWECLPMAGAAFSVAGYLLSSDRERLMRMLAMQSMISGALAIFVFTRYPIAEGRGAIGTGHFFMLAFCSVSVFPLGYLRHYSARLQIAAILGYCAFAYCTLQYQSRGGSLIVFIIVPLVFIGTQLHEGIAGIANVRTIAAALLILCGVGYALTRPAILAQVEVGLHGTLDRLFNGDESPSIDGFRDSVDNEMEESRGAEAREFLSKSTIITWLVGHGWGGGWNSELMTSSGNWQLVHFGPLNLVLKGGVPLLFCFHMLFIGGLVRSLRCLGRDSLAAPSVCYMVFFYSNFIKHGPMAQNYGSYVTWVIFGIALGCTTRAATRFAPVFARPGNKRLVLVSEH